MTEYYFINQEIVTSNNTASFGDPESDVELDPVDLLNGARLSPEPTFINFKLSKNSGDFYPDIFNSLITLFSNKVKNVLDKCGIDIIDYYPVKILDADSNTVNSDYWLANICSRISCLDVENSDTQVDVFGDGLDFESFCIDETKSMGAELFRLHEDGTLIIINERVYKELEKAGLQGVIMMNTRDYNGYGI